MSFVNISQGKAAEPLQNYAFWLVDLAPIDTLGLPIFLPGLGFQSITAPEVVVNSKEIREGNAYFSRKVIQSASVNKLTLTRGVRFFDSDFDRWTRAAIIGNTQGTGSSAILNEMLVVGGPTYRRTMMLIHFFSRITVNDWMAGLAEIGAAAAASGAATDISAGLGFYAQQYTGNAAAAGFSGSNGWSAFGMGPYDQVARLPAKAYVLYGCIPTRYKTGSGFDASSSEISIAELDIDYEHFEEISLSG